MLGSKVESRKLKVGNGPEALASIGQPAEVRRRPRCASSPAQVLRSFDLRLSTFNLRGSVLILVTWILILLVAITASLVRTVHVELEASRRAGAGFLARALAESGIEWTIASLYVQGPTSAGSEPVWRNAPDTFDSMPLGAGTWTLYYYDPSNDERRFGVVEESSKLNVNIATAEMIESVVAGVMESSRRTWPYTSTEVAAAILDFRDADTEASESGAESEYYQTLLPPYEPKNAAFESLAELLLVRGIDETLLWGEDVNRNGRLDLAEDDGTERWPEDDADTLLAPGLAHYLTVYSYDVNETADGEARINLTSASEEELRTALGGVVSAEGLDAMVRFQRRPGFSTVGQLVDVEGLTLADIRAAIDLVTTTDEPHQYGLVNVATAPLEVLAVLPGLSDESAAALVAYRAGATTGMDSIGWILNVIDEDAFRTASSYLTAKSYQFEMAAVGEALGVSHRLRAVVDLARDDAPGRYLHFQDESWLGPVFAASEMEEDGP